LQVRLVAEIGAEAVVGYIAVLYVREPRAKAAGDEWRLVEVGDDLGLAG
jgi:hypothetical protein